mgnify:CR=1 FL=1
MQIAIERNGVSLTTKAFKFIRGENKEKDQHLTVLIMEQVRQRSSQKIDNVEDIDPTKEFPTIDVQAIDVTPAALKDRVK